MRPLFIATVFANSLLLFLVEPLIAKQLLPIFGGSPLVWNTCLLFFQFALLLGYLWGHLSFRWFGPKRQPYAHFVVALLPLVTLPLRLPEALVRIYEDALRSNPSSLIAQPSVMVLAMLTVSVGLPFFALAGGAPIIQRWFSHTNDASASNPYFLYQASNFGSMIALIGYPAWFERQFGLKDQGVWWSVAYGVLLLGLLGAGLRGRAETEEVATPKDPPPTARERWNWVMLSAGPSAFLLATTGYITVNLAPIPLLWILPLALYLLTFIVAFGNWSDGGYRAIRYAAPLLACPALVLFLRPLVAPPMISIGLFLLGFFAVTLLCHSELGRVKPEAARLTDFFLWVSLGGVIGGIFAAIVAPLVFKTLGEYPWSLGACFFAVAFSRNERFHVLLDFFVPVILAGGAWALENRASGSAGEWNWVYIAFVLMLVGSLKPVRAFVAAASILLFFHLLGQSKDVIYRQRNFYGSKYVTSDGEVHRLVNGTTRHGIQFLDPRFRRTPSSYYSSMSGVGRALAYLKGRDELHHLAVVGLGTGTLAAFIDKGQAIDFYELDPGVERIARDPRLFTYLSDCPGKASVILGDARIRLAEAPKGAYDAIALDAFASDAIPVHLLTEEAFRMYMDRLTPNGLLLVHVSNRYLRLEPVVAAIRDRLGLDGFVVTDFHVSDERRNRGENPSVWIAVGRKGSLANLSRDPKWKKFSTDPSIRSWTDDYSNVLSAFLWQTR